MRSSWIYVHVCWLLVLLSPASLVNNADSLASYLSSLNHPDKPQQPLYLLPSPNGRAVALLEESHIATWTTMEILPYVSWVCLLGLLPSHIAIRPHSHASFPALYHFLPPSSGPQLVSAFSEKTEVISHKTPIKLHSQHSQLESRQISVHTNCYFHFFDFGWVRDVSSLAHASLLPWFMTPAHPAWATAVIKLVSSSQVQILQSVPVSTFPLTTPFPWTLSHWLSPSQMLLTLQVSAQASTIPDTCAIHPN